VIALSTLVALGCGAIKRAGYAPDDRDEWQRPDEVVARLAIEPGDRVADLGAGGGYFTFRLADAVGSQGRVYAVDVDESMTDYLSERAREQGRQNVEVILGEYDDPKLPDGTIDLIFTSNTYHHLEDREAYFENVREALAPDGRVAIIDFNEQEGGWFVRTFGHATSKETIVEEMSAAGYRLERDHDDLERQHFLVFTVGDQS
jgi:ubiquinone/menaquinone biosynthesis C-methylase UbiE